MYHTKYSPLSAFWLHLSSRLHSFTARHSPNELVGRHANLARLIPLTGRLCMVPNYSCMTGPVTVRSNWTPICSFWRDSHPLCNFISCSWLRYRRFWATNSLSNERLDIYDSIWLTVGPLNSSETISSSTKGKKAQQVVLQHFTLIL